MPEDRIVAALEELQAERVAVLEQLQIKQREVEDAVSQINKLNDAIQSLVSLRPELINHRTRQALEAVADEEPFTDPTEVPTLPDTPDPIARLKPFITPGGDGKNLQSALMVAAVVDAIGHPVTRDTLQSAFFNYFTDVQLSGYWQQPAKAFRTALRRAIERGMVLEVRNDGDPMMYMGSFRRRRSSYAEVTS